MPIPVYSDFYFKLPGSSVNPTFSSGALSTPTYSFVANYPQPTYQGNISAIHTPVKVLKAKTGQGIVVQTNYNESNSFYRLGVKTNTDNTSGGAIYGIPDAYYHLPQKGWARGRVDEWTTKKNRKYTTLDYSNTQIAGNHASIKVTKPSGETWTLLQRIYKNVTTGAYSNVQKAGWVFYGSSANRYESSETSAVLFYSLEYDRGNMLGSGNSYTTVPKITAGTFSTIPQDAYYDDTNNYVRSIGAGTKSFGYMCGINETSGAAFIFNPDSLSFTDDEIRGYLPSTPYIKTVVPVFSNTAILTEKSFSGTTLTYKGHFSDYFHSHYAKNTLDNTTPMPILADYDKGLYNDSDHSLLLDGNGRYIIKKTKYAEQEYSNVSWRGAFGDETRDFHSNLTCVYASVSGDPRFGLPYKIDPYYINLNYDDATNDYYFGKSQISGAGYIDLEPINKIIVPYVKFNIIIDEYANSIFTAGDFDGASVVLYKLSYLGNSVNSARWTKIGTYSMPKTVVPSSPAMGGVDEAVFTYDLTSIVNSNISPGEFSDFAIAVYFAFNTPTRYTQVSLFSYHNKSCFLSQSTPPLYDLAPITISETNEVTKGIQGAYFPKTYTKLIIEKTGTDNTLTSTGSISAGNLTLSRTDLGKFEIANSVGNKNYKLFNPITSTEYVNEGDQIENVYLVDMDTGEFYSHSSQNWADNYNYNIFSYPTSMAVSSLKKTRLNLAYIINHKLYISSNYTDDGDYINIQISEIWKTNNGGITWTKSPIIIPDYSWMDP